MDLRGDVSIKKKKKKIFLREARFFHWSSNIDLILLSESSEAKPRQGHFPLRGGERGRVGGTGLGQSVASLELVDIRPAG